MLNVEILGNSYTIKNEWTDVTIKDMVGVQEYLDNLPILIEKYIYSDDTVEVPEDKIIKFYIDWIEMFSTIPREYLEGEISVTGTDEFTLVEVFGLVSKFLWEPQDLELSDTITFKGKDYTLIESTETASGISKMLGGATYKHFTESQALISLFQNKQYKKWDYLSRITAILFRPDKNEQYEEEIIDVRAKIFKDLPLSEAYKGYFFLQKRMTELQEPTQIFLEVQKVKESHLTQPPKRSLISSIGRFKPMNWLKKAFFPAKT